MNPIATAFITVYNEETWIERAVRSLLGQTCRDIEVLVVDDGSTDRTAEILASIPDDRLRIVRRQRAGRAASLAFAASEARGRYLANLDADDEAYPDRLAEQIAFLQRHEDHGWVGCAEEREDSQRREHIIRAFPQHDPEIRRQATKCIPYCHSSIMFRRELVEQGVNYDPHQEFLIDFEFFLRVARRCKVANLPGVLVKRRLRDESYFQRTFSRSRQQRRLALFCSRAVQEFQLSPLYYAYPAARLGYNLMPAPVQRRIRAAAGLVEATWNGK